MVLWQNYSSSLIDQHDAVGSKLTLNFSYDLFNRGQANALSLDVAVEDRRPLGTDLAPLQAGMATGSMIPTAATYGDFSLGVTQAYIRQNLAGNRFHYTIGKIFAPNFLNAYPFFDDNRQFLTQAFSTSPSIASPLRGFGAVAAWYPTSGGLYVKPGVFTVHSSDTGSTIDDFFSKDEHFYMLEVGFTSLARTRTPIHARAAMDANNIHLTAWYKDPEQGGLPRARGLAFNANYMAGEQLMWFVRAGWSCRWPSTSRSCSGSPRSWWGCSTRPSWPKGPTPCASSPSVPRSAPCSRWPRPGSSTRARTAPCSARWPPPRRCRSCCWRYWSRGWAPPARPSPTWPRAASCTSPLRIGPIGACARCAGAAAGRQPTTARRRCRPPAAGPCGCRFPAASDVEVPEGRIGRPPWRARMRVMVMVKATPSSEAGELPSGQLLADMGRYNEELVRAGVMLAGEGLHPSSKGVRVRFSGRQRSVVDGPFTETKELVAGFWLWQVRSMEEAIEWVRRCPNPMPEDSEIEIRPVFEEEDFGAEFTPELHEQERRLREQIGSRG